MLSCVIDFLVVNPGSVQVGIPGLIFPSDCSVNRQLVMFDSSGVQFHFLILLPSY